MKGKPTDLLPKFWKEHGITQLCFEEDTEPYAEERDEEIRKLAKKEGIAFLDHFTRRMYDEGFDKNTLPQLRDIIFLMEQG